MATIPPMKIELTNSSKKTMDDLTKAINRFEKSLDAFNDNFVVMVRMLKEKLEEDDESQRSSSTESSS